MGAQHDIAQETRAVAVPDANLKLLSEQPVCLILAQPGLSILKCLAFIGPVVPESQALAGFDDSIKESLGVVLVIATQQHEGALKLLEERDQNSLLHFCHEVSPLFFLFGCATIVSSIKACIK